MSVQHPVYSSRTADSKMRSFLVLGTLCAVLGLQLRAAEAVDCACATTNVNMRSGAGTRFFRWGLLTTGSCVTVKSERASANGFNWVNVNYNGRDAWIASNFININRCSCACATTNVNIRSGPGTSYSRRGLLTRGSCVTSLGGRSSTWVQVEYNGQEAWIASRYVNIGACSGSSGSSSGSSSGGSSGGSGSVPPGCPRIISRAGWGARPPRSTSSMPALPRYVFIHHGASSSCNSQTSCAAKVRDYQNYHMDDRGWSDIGYSFIVGEDGNVYEGRGWTARGAHTSGYNSVGLGICVIGNFSNRAPNSAAQTAVRRLIQCGVTAGKISATYRLLGHRDVGSTSCPGTRFYDVIRTWSRYGQ